MAATQASVQCTRDSSARQAFTAPLASGGGVVGSRQTVSAGAALPSRRKLSSPRVPPAAEAVDRLLRIADQEQRGRPARGAEHAVEDLPLARVRVLELVHQGDGVLAAQGLHECHATRAVEGVGHPVDQVVVRHHATLLLQFRKALAGVGPHLVQPRHAALRTIRLAVAQGLEMGLDQPAQRRTRRAADVRLVGLAAQRVLGKAVDLGVQRRGGVAGFAPRGQVAPQPLEPVGLVAAPVEDLAIERIQQRPEERRAVHAEAVRQRATRAKQHGHRILRQRRRGRQQVGFTQEEPKIFGERLRPSGQTSQ